MFSYNYKGFLFYIKLLIFPHFFFQYHIGKIKAKGLSRKGFSGGN